jgi:hypothetical protein
MRFSLIFSFVLISHLTFGQHPSDESSFDFSSFDKTDKSTKIKLMNLVKNNFGQFKNLADWPDCCLNDFHFIDIDNDGDLDLIFNGWSGSADSDVEIFMNINNNFKKVFAESSYVENIVFNNHKFKQIKIYDPGCCGAFDAHEYTFDFKLEKDSLQYWLVEHLKNHNSFAEPVKINDSIRFEVTNDRYYLRITPEIDTVQYFYPSDKGNIYEIYETGNKGTAIAEQIDKTGGIWSCVIMDNLKDRKYRTANNDDFSPRIKGWMSSKYLRRIK